MIHVTRVEALEDLTALQHLFEQNGIPIYVEGVRAFRTGIASIYVYIDSQYPDALALMSNPNHEVAMPVDVNAYYESLANVGHTEILKFLFKVLAVVAVAFILVLLAFNK